MLGLGLRGLSLGQRGGGGEPYGPELITNTSTANWPAGLGGEAGTNVYWTAGVIKVEHDGTAFGSRSQGVPTTIGETYEVSVTYKANGTSKGNARKSDAATFNSSPVDILNGVGPSASDTTATVQFVATTTTSYIHIGVWNEGAGSYAEYSDISVRQVL